MLGLKHIRTKPYTPKTNGKAERFIQTSLREWAYGRAYNTSDERTAQLPRWLHRYNWHRPHGSIGAKPPISRLALIGNNLLRLHSSRAPEADSERGPDNRRAARASPERAERDKEGQRGRRNDDDDRVSRGEIRRQRRHRGADRECDCGSARGFDRFWRRPIGEARFVARMGGERVLGHELTRDPPCELRLKPRSS